jgi:hypothetical protein
MRVEPAIGSAPVSRKMPCSASLSSGVSRLLAMPMVSAPRRYGLAQARHGERRRAARRQRDHHIRGPDVDQLVAAPDLIFRALDRLHHRRPAAGKQQDKPVARPAEGRHQLGAILHGKPPGCSRPGVNEAAASPEPWLHRQAGPFDCRQGGAHRGDGGELPADHGLQHVAGFPNIDIRKAWAGAFRFHRVHRHCLKKGNAHHQI